MHRRLRWSLFTVLLCLFALPATLFAMPPAIGLDDAGNPLYPICPTEDIWAERRVQLGLDDALFRAACPLEGLCDDPAVRDSTPQNPFTVSVIVHVMRSDSGQSPSGLTQADIDAQIAEMNADFAQTGIQFQLSATRFHNDSNYYCISSYSPFNASWYNDIQNMKATYSEDPANNLNIFVSCQDSSRWGILLGIATFPWDPAALTATGGLWLNSAYTGAGNKTASHEVGHCLGLWHTHHGVSETSGCADDCRENVHALNDPAADLVGDFCKDTPPTPTNYECSNASGTDCNNVSWGYTMPENFMGYGPDSCLNLFTADQSARMNCWTLDVLSGWIVDGGGGGCEDTVPSAPSNVTVTSLNDTQLRVDWSDNSSDEDGFIISRNGVDIAAVGSGVTTFTDGGLACETSYTYSVRAQNCAGESSASSGSGTTGTCPAGPVVHVAAIDVSATTRGPWAEANASVLIVDASGNPMSGASVSASWSGTVSSTQSAVTGSDGRASFASGRVRTSSYCFTLTVNDVTLSGATYDSAANTETSDSAGNACGSRIDPARTAPAYATITGNQPNPFNPRTEIQFYLPQAGEVQIAVYDISGRLVRTLLAGSHSAGPGSVTWDGTDLSGHVVGSGVYLAKLEAGDQVQTHRMMLLK